MQKYAVIGLGRFGRMLALQLADLGAEVIAVDREEHQVAAVRDQVSVALCMDGTDERLLREQGVGAVDVGIVAMAECFEETQLATVVLLRLGVPRVVVKSASPLHDKILRQVGAKEVVSPEKESAIRLAQKLVVPNIVDYLALSEDTSLVQLTPPPAFHGKTLRELDVRNVHRVNIVAIKKRTEAGRDEDGEVIWDEILEVVPRATAVIASTDILVVIGKSEDVSRLVT